MAVGVDNPARGLALAALGQYNKLIKIKSWTITNTTDVNNDVTNVRVAQDVNYKYFDGDGNTYESSFRVNDGKGIWKFLLNDGSDPNAVALGCPTAAFRDQFKDADGNYLGYNATHVYFVIIYSDNTFYEFKEPIAQFSFKKIILAYDTYHGVLPPVEEAQDNAIYFLEMEPDPVTGESVYKMYMKTINAETSIYEWTNIGSTEFDLTGYQLKIDSAIKYTTPNYDTATQTAEPTAPNVVGGVNQALAEIGPAVNADGTPHLDFSSDVSNLGLSNQILNTLDPGFIKRSDILTALNEHEKELGFEYDYGTGKLINLGVDPDHTVNLAEIIKEIGDVSKLELDHIPGDTPEEKKQHIKDHSWTLVD